MTDVPGASAAHGPDDDLLEYLLIAVPAVELLAGVVASVARLVRSGVLGLVDVVLLRRAPDQASVTAHTLRDVEQLAPLAALEDPRVRLSAHDVALAAVAVEPDAAALLLLIEDRWATALAAAARAAGGRIVGGERLARVRVVAAGDVTGAAAGRRGAADLLVRGPATGLHPELAVDPAAQLRTLAELVERGVLTFDQYEAQRRRVLEG
ncbi:hypothetical protein [Krasilnikoviella flava]|uniref:Short C-terminal domain-containing protein n=1 Tax=Krasilnikoviella flava TaxID=526729 RepID=A0A1T5KSK7_9MICO|nr:hypothetical protein [Krasilnikoviella flava]SKC66677.1 hypothetical protein SAMN04324258_2350 [Krasilnikoviella flava]